MTQVNRTKLRCYGYGVTVCYGVDFSCLKYTVAVTLVILSLELKPYYILPEGYRARPPGPEPQLEDSYSATGRLLTSRRDTIAYGTIPCIDLRKEDLDGPSSLVRMCVKID